MLAALGSLSKQEVGEGINEQHGQALWIRMGIIN